MFLLMVVLYQLKLWIQVLIYSAIGTIDTVLRSKTFVGIRSCLFFNCHVPTSWNKNIILSFSKLNESFLTILAVNEECEITVQCCCESRPNVGICRRNSIRGCNSFIITLHSCDLHAIIFARIYIYIYIAVILNNCAYFKLKLNWFQTSLFKLKWK